MNEPITSDALSRLKSRLARPQDQYVITVDDNLARALVECAEALQYAIDYEAGEVGCVRHWKFVARDILAKLEAL